MTTRAAVAFSANLIDVERLFSIYASHPGQRKRTERLAVLNKVAIVLITSSWETYCEDLAAEVVLHLAREAADPTKIPHALRRRVADELKRDLHNLAVWQLADGGWRKVLSQRVYEKQRAGTWGINTPKSRQVGDFFAHEAGIDDVVQHWTWHGMPHERAALLLDDFVSLRGAIAHRAATPERVYKSTVKSYLRHVTKLVQVMEDHVDARVLGLVGVPLHGCAG